MNKTEFIAKIVEKSGVNKKDVEAVVKTGIDVTIETLVNKDTIQLTGFGTFKTVHRKETTARNPKTGESITVPAKDVPKFIFANGVKDVVK